jgi:hypothetical protein
MRVWVLVCSLIATGGCATQSSVAPSDGPWRFSGTISAMDGRQVSGPIVGAHLTVTSGANAATAATSDGSGHYLFEQLDSGRFTVTIDAPGYVTATPVIDLYRDMEVDFALTPQ